MIKNESVLHLTLYIRLIHLLEMYALMMFWTLILVCGLYYNKGMLFELEMLLLLIKGALGFTHVACKDGQLSLACII